MMHKQPHKDTVNPPGQIVNRPEFDRPLAQEIKRYEAKQAWDAGYHAGFADGIASVKREEQFKSIALGNSEYGR